jgi:serine acetyltransferase
MFDQMRRDIRVVMERDPAARSALEVAFCYRASMPSGFTVPLTGCGVTAGS